MGIVRTLALIVVVCSFGTDAAEASPREAQASARAPKAKKRKARVKKQRARAPKPEPAPTPEPTEDPLATTTQEPEAPAPAPETTVVVEAPTVEPVAIAESRSEGPAPLIGISASVTGTAQLQDRDQRTMLAVASFGYARPGVSVFAKVGWVHDSAASGSGVSNVLLGATLPFKLGGGFALELRLVGIAPIGTGGGNDAKPAAHGASLAGTDWGGPMFAPNHASGAPAVRLVYGRGRWFALADSAFYYARRVRGEMVDPLGPTVMFSSSKLVVGASLLPVLTTYGGVAQTHYWGHPAFLGDDPGAARDDHYAFGGVDFAKRFTSSQLRLGVLYGRAIDAPKLDRKFQVAEVTTGFDF